MSLSNCKDVKAGHSFTFRIKINKPLRTNEKSVCILSKVWSLFAICYFCVYFSFVLFSITYPKLKTENVPARQIHFAFRVLPPEFCYVTCSTLRMNVVHSIAPYWWFFIQIIDYYILDVDLDVISAIISMWRCLMLFYRQF